jgi:hypothetical protein
MSQRHPESQMDCRYLEVLGTALKANAERRILTGHWIRHRRVYGTISVSRQGLAPLERNRTSAPVLVRGPATRLRGS